MELKQSIIMSRSPRELSTIRMSKSLRDSLKVSLGDLLLVHDVPLQVNKLFNRDREHTDVAFVAKQTLKKLGIVTSDICVDPHITLGCDPEFFLVDTKTNILYNPGFLVKKLAPVGYDGMLAELRPNPSISPKKVVENIKELLTNLNSLLNTKNLQHVRMIAKSSGWGLYAGFHVHLGIPKHLLIPKDNENYVNILQTIVKALDYYVGTLSVIAEGNDYERRCSPFVAYGKVGDFRADNYTTLEYRVPGGTLLKHPVLSEGLLSLSSLVAHDTIERIRLVTNDYKDKISSASELVREIYPNVIDTEDMYAVISATSADKAKGQYHIIMKDLSCMVNYQDHRSAIDNFSTTLTKPIPDDIWLNWNN